MDVGIISQANRTRGFKEGFKVSEDFFRGTNARLALCVGALADDNEPLSRAHLLKKIQHRFHAPWNPSQKYRLVLTDGCGAIVFNGHFDKTMSQCQVAGQNARAEMPREQPFPVSGSGTD